MVKIILIEDNTEKRIAGIKVHLEDESHNYWERPTNDSGEMSIIIPRDGYYRIKVRDINHRPYTKKHFLSRHSIVTIYLDKSW